MAKQSKSDQLLASDSVSLLRILELRFNENGHRHPKLKWGPIEKKLIAQPESIRSLGQMEATGGEPDVIALNRSSGEFWFVDCAPETPQGRRSICYDRAAWESRKEHKPKTSATELAAEMGVELLDESQYLQLQELGPFDQKTSSWLWTPPSVRQLGGALFGDYRFGRTFIYHNGAESYYSVRGFRGLLKV
ncbi:MAG: DUF4256 domain-containing protein [Planctomycetaceae bacterium]|nr:DUF4256 domain-containing protein [Planctomycetaceae bacterium]